MKITNFGSCCIDNVYSVPRFVNPGETLPASAYEVHAGGKGLNQSLALAYAGASVRHVGKVGRDGVWMKTLLADAGIDTSHLQVVDGPSGHANIQVTPAGDNAIVIFGGANRTIGPQDIEAGLAAAEPGGFLLLQNEISCLDALIRLGHERRQRIVFNAAPFTHDVNRLPLDYIEFFIVNELEGEALTGETKPQRILARMIKQFPHARIILTLGEKGAVYADGDRKAEQPAFPVEPVDTTGAGDTFVGYFLAGWVAGKDVVECLADACRAAALCTTAKGAATSIPSRGAM